MTRNGEFKRLIKYKPPFVLGHDMAGVVTAVGADVPDFKVGDDMYARPRDLRIGTFAEFIAIGQTTSRPSRTRSRLRKPPPYRWSPWSRGRSWSTVRTCSRVRGCSSTLGRRPRLDGHPVSPYLGAIVATTAATATADLVSSLGANIIIDYTKQDYSQTLSGYDLVIDSLGGQNLEKSLTVLKPGGLFAIGVAGPPDAGFARQLGAPSILRAVHSPAQPQGPQAGEGDRCALRVLLHAGQRLPAARARWPV